MVSAFQERYPWTKSPPIANAAMAGFAGAPLAIAVSRAGGIGIIGASDNMVILDQELVSAKEALKDDGLAVPGLSSLPLGVGFLVFFTKLDSAVEVIKRHKPAIVCLSCAPENKDYTAWSHAMKEASPSSRIWIQVASVSVAIEVARTCMPDVLIMQGSDAGGHGPCPGASIVSLVPETRDALDRAGFTNIDIFAAGGISDGRGVAAALVSGAKGAVLGTRFLASEEINLPAVDYREAILKTSDGGLSTTRAVVFDELKGKNIWPPGYDGRALTGLSYVEFLSGASLDEIRSRHAIAVKEDHKGYGGERRAAIWAGSGIGLVTEVKGAGQIVVELRAVAKDCIERVRLQI